MSEIENKLCKILEVTKLSDKQRQYIKKWSEEWELSLKDIVEAYDIMFSNMGMISWGYWDRILKNKFVLGLDP